MQTNSKRVVLGSGSPRRLQLLSMLIDESCIEVITPDCDELSLSEPMSSKDIDIGLRENVRRKQEAVSDRLSEDTVVICADTVVVVRESSTAFRCLGKPPVDGWTKTVAEWFAAYYSQDVHWVRT
ncbi:MAG: Maf family protein, partial [Planctomycetaceae bacterium]